ncbi:hypothetical protein ACG83_31140 [Frankia sp. R43]|nr:hypothetical protein ACG83_31140 [Frankia sp. R43]
MRHQLARQVAHWRAATVALGDLEAFAAPAAWAGVEHYLSRELRRHLTGVVAALRARGDHLAAQVASGSGEDLATVQRELVAYRRRYLQVETVLEFFGDAVNHRATPRLGALLRGLDMLAADSLLPVLGPLGHAAPPVLTYVDKGLGASILRARVRLWDGGSLSPAAAIKVTRHNLLRPTALIHETGHQVAHLTGWNAELAGVLRAVAGPAGSPASLAWSSWASEVAADVHAFALVGYGAVAALHDVVAGERESVYRILPGDPHPAAWLRVLFNVELCRLWFGAGPWDELGAAWVATHPLERGTPELRVVARDTLPRLSALAAACTRRPMRSFDGRALAALADPTRVSPTELERLAARAGDSLWTSTHLQRHESLRILAWTSLRAALDLADAPRVAARFEDWLLRAGDGPATLPSI